ncbi:MAG TPA: hypothetical protein VNZ22_01305, partial [Bacillota bacterium]|nr:hypothetical protein [Bacillota bacterium]
PARGQALTEQEKKEITAILADNQGVVRLLHSVPPGSRSRYPLDLKQGCQVALPHLSKEKRAVQLLSSEALLAAANGQNQAAVQALAAAGQAADSLSEEPLLISQLVRIACWRLVLSRLERVLSQAPLTDEQLIMLEGTLAKAEQPQGLLRALVGEQAFGLAVFADPHTAFFLSRNPKPSERLGTLGLISLLKSTGLLQRDRAFFLDCMRTNLVIAEASFPERARRGQQVAATGFRPPNRFYVFSSMLLPALSNCILRDTEHAGRIRAAQAALAVERFRLAHAGTLPADLQQLVPQYLSCVPADPFDGQPLRFKKLAVGYVIYSIGDDKRDDGGREADPKKSTAPYDITFFVER